MPKISRREFVESMAVAGAGACLCGLSGCATITGKGNTPEIQPGAYLVEDGKVRITLNQVKELANIGGSAKISDAKLPEPIIIARTGGNQFAAVSIKCPHRGVEVEYDAAQQQFRCASIGHSLFDIKGTFIKGPAKKSLTRYSARLGLFDRDKLIVYLT